MNGTPRQSQIRSKGLGAGTVCCPLALESCTVNTSLSSAINMDNKTSRAIAELRKGLNLLSRDRPVVIPHHKAFALVEQMQEHLADVEKALQKGSSKTPKTADAEKAPAKSAKTNK